eukprot:gene4494-5091_t
MQEKTCLIKPHADSFILKSRNIATIPDLFNEANLTLEYHELIKTCSETIIGSSETDIKKIEKDARSQSKGSAFFRHRAGRIAATDHGCKHEQDAFEKKMKASHLNYQISKCGMFVRQDFPWLHRTPDFLSMCDCCCEGFGEVKCPFCLDGVDFERYASKPNSCLETVDGKIHLKRKHSYCYQIQQQLFTTNNGFCDFDVCGFTDTEAAFIHKELYLMITTGTMFCQSYRNFGDIAFFQKSYGDGIQGDHRC